MYIRRARRAKHIWMYHFVCCRFAICKIAWSRGKRRTFAAAQSFFPWKCRLEKRSWSAVWRQTPRQKSAGANTIVTMKPPNNAELITGRAFFGQNGARRIVIWINLSCGATDRRRCGVWSTMSFAIESKSLQENVLTMFKGQPALHNDALRRSVASFNWNVWNVLSRLCFV